jgi:membrane protein implicated in regulation of membrane protease activity
LIAFWIVGGAGAVLFLASLFLGDVLDGMFDGLEGLAGGLLSTAAIAGFAGAFGLAGGTVMAATDVGFGVAALVGVVAGALMATFSALLTRSMHRAPTDRTPGPQDLVGASGVVVTPIQAGSYGEIVVQVGGHRLKLSARAAEPIASGEDVVVTQSLSATSVRVTRV